MVSICRRQIEVELNRFFNIVYCMRLGIFFSDTKKCAVLYSSCCVLQSAFDSYSAGDRASEFLQSWGNRQKIHAIALALYDVLGKKASGATENRGFKRQDI